MNMFKRNSQGSRKNRSGQLQEHTRALVENAVFDIAKTQEAQEAEKSIGGISENLGIPTDDAESVQNELS